MVAGVCGGLGRHLGVDPVVFRVLFAVFAVFGGVGALVYGLIWLISPEDGQERSAAAQLAAGRLDLSTGIALAVSFFGLLAFARFLMDGFGAEVPFLVVATFVAALVLAENRSRGIGRFAGRGGSPGWTPPPTWAAGPPNPAAAPPSGAARQGWTSGAETTATMPAAGATSPGLGQPARLGQPAGLGQPAAPTADQQPGVPGTPGTPWAAGAAGAPGWRQPPWPPGPPPWWQQPRPATAGQDGGGATPGAVPPGAMGREPWGGVPEPKRRREHSGFGCLLFFVGLALAGALLALDAAGAVHVSLRAVLATVLVVLGVGLVAGAWYGRARIVILLASIATVALVLVASPALSLQGGVGGRQWAPVSAADASVPHHVAIGDGRLDLTTLRQRDTWVPVTASVGVGRLLVWVPDNMTVLVAEHAGAGTVIVTDNGLTPGNRGGLGVDRSYRFAPAPGRDSHGTIDLSVKVGVGLVEVRRVAA